MNKNEIITRLYYLIEYKQSEKYSYLKKTWITYKNLEYNEDRDSLLLRHSIFNDFTSYIALIENFKILTNSWNKDIGFRLWLEMNMEYMNYNNIAYNILKDKDKEEL